MKLFTKCVLGMAILLGMPAQMSAAVYATPKQEMRSAWVATVWSLDWPSTKITKTGNASQIAAQKNQMIELLDSMAANNMNAINFQVRSRSDAMYKSSYEPWSSDLVSERGMDPGYDPLAFVVEECHKRGLECHAWVNPYRYESVVGQWNSDPTNYRTNHPDWLLDVNGASILNPGKEEVIQRITDICREIVTNYDVDGILYDDYFYLQGITDAQDDTLYTAYTKAGGTLSRGDWRRDNVNRMVKSVYNMIQTVKPWVRFGISPAGVACTSSSVASKYGISPCPSGSDWQYNGIYSDPIAWYNDKSVDFISPQIYWTIGNSTNYEKIAPWWSEVANKFGRHFYSSHSITSLRSSSTEAPQRSGLENSLISLKASGPNNTSYTEYANEIELNRTSSLDNAPGSIFYSCKYMYKSGVTGSKESFSHFLKRTVYTCKAIVPTMTWKTAEKQGTVTNLNFVNGKLSWDSVANVRYTIYAIPNSTEVTSATFAKDVDKLIGISYSTTFEVPEYYSAGYKYAVCILDRYGNEYDAAIYENQSTQTLDAPTLTSPANGATVGDPFTLTWSSVTNASAYFVELSLDSSFDTILKTVRTTGTSISSSEFIENLTTSIPVYWRVRACATGYKDGVSASQTFIPEILSITYPADGAEDVYPVFTATWNLSDGSTTGLVEIATDEDFSDIVFSAESVNGSAAVTDMTLKCRATYYIRVKMNGKYSKTVKFTTEAVEAKVPTFTCPASDGATVFSDSKLAVASDIAAYTVTIEVSTSSTSWGRTRYVVTLDPYTFTSTVNASTIKASGSLLADGKTYYARARARYVAKDGSYADTDYSTPVSFVYSSQSGGVESVALNDVVKLVTGADAKVIIASPSAANVAVKAYSMLGSAEKTLFDGSADNVEVSLSDLSQGMHIIVVTVDGATKTFKLVK